MSGRRVIRLGDPTTHGGAVISATSRFSMFGKQVARIGDQCTCPIPGHGVVTIVEGDPSWRIDGRPIALEGHKCSCGCSLISTLSNVLRSPEGSGIESVGVGTIAGYAGNTSTRFEPYDVNLNPKTPAPAPPEQGSAAPAAAAPAAGGGAPVKTGLGDDVDKLAAKSPSLQKDLEKLKKDKWEIEYGEAGGGSYANRDSTPPKITIDGAEKGNPAAVTQTLAHEAGHATYTYTPDYSSKAAYLKGPLGDEGAATLNNIKVQREILANGGPDIGIAGNNANQAAYNHAYDLYLKDGNAGSARDAIGSIFGKGESTSNTGQPYADYYGGWYDKAYPSKK